MYPWCTRAPAHGEIELHMVLQEGARCMARCAGPLYVHASCVDTNAFFCVLIEVPDV